jgi:hypothetical protein
MFINGLYTVYSEKWAMMKVKPSENDEFYK